MRERPSWSSTCWSTCSTRRSTPASSAGAGSGDWQRARTQRRPVTATVVGPAALAGDLSVPPRAGSRRDVLRGLLRDRTARVGLVLVTMLVLGAVFAPL